MTNAMENLLQSLSDAQDAYARDCALLSVAHAEFKRSRSAKRLEAFRVLEAKTDAHLDRVHALFDALDQLEEKEAADEIARISAVMRAEEPELAL